MSIVKIGIFLLVILIVSALALVTLRNENRRLTRQIEHEIKKEKEIDDRHNQLTIERSYFAGPREVEKAAKEHLKMKHPSSEDTRLLSPLDVGDEK